MPWGLAMADPATPLRDQLRLLADYL